MLSISGEISSMDERKSPTEPRGATRWGSSYWGNWSCSLSPLHLTSVGTGWNYLTDYATAMRAVRLLLLVALTTVVVGSAWVWVMRPTTSIGPTARASQAPRVAVVFDPGCSTIGGFVLNATGQDVSALGPCRGSSMDTRLGDSGVVVIRCMDTRVGGGNNYAVFEPQCWPAPTPRRVAVN